MSVLFITIGLRDVQYVLPDKDNQEEFVRISITGYHNVNRNFDELDLELSLHEEKVNREIKRNEENAYKGIKPVGVCFPILEKTLIKLKSEIENLEAIYLLSTNRGDILDRFTKLKEPLQDKGYKDALLYLGKLEDLAKKDITSFSGEKIMLELTNNPKHFGISDVSVTHLSIGEKADYLHLLTPRTIRQSKSEKACLNLLSRGDINRIDFFYPECYKELQPCFENLKNADIFLSFSGGMPLMQRSIEQIFLSTGIGRQIESINIPEQDNEIIVRKKTTTEYSFLFSQIKLLRQALNSFYFDQAISYWENIKVLFDQKSIEYKSIEKKILALQTGGDPFKLIYAKFLSALYREDYIQILILVKSIQETTVSKLLINYANTSNIEFIPFHQSGNIKADCLKIDGKYFNINYTEIFSDTTGWKTDENLVAYAKLFFNEDSLSDYKPAFYSIRNLRNSYLHSGYIQHSEINKYLPEILSFLNLSEEMAEVRKSINNNDITQEVLNFEQNLTGESSFMSLIADMLGKKDNFIFDVRNSIQNLISLLITCPLKRN